MFVVTTWKVVAKKAFSTQRDKGTKGQSREKHYPVAPFEPLFLCPFVLFFAFSSLTFQVVCCSDLGNAGKAPWRFSRKRLAVSSASGCLSDTLL
jgi:hypothetical protein